MGKKFKYDPDKDPRLLPRQVKPLTHDDIHSAQVVPDYDSVKKPAHYNRGKIEVWDFIIDQGLDYCCGNAVKYICRAGEKDPSKHIEDLDKAIAFLEREKKKVQDNA